MSLDPRLWIARTYGTIGDNAELKAQFENEYMNCNGPDHAIEICKKYLSLATAS